MDELGFSVPRFGAFHALLWFFLTCLRLECSQMALNFICIYSLKVFFNGRNEAGKFDMFC